MKPVEFPEANARLTPPSCLTEAECGKLPVYRDGQYCISCWELSSDDLMEILQTKRVWLWVMGETQPPVLLTASKPWEPE